MSAVTEVGDRYLDQLADLDPIGATFMGIAGHDTALTDFSPAGIDARTELTRRTLAELGAVETDGSDADRLARDFLAERLRTTLAGLDAGDELRALSNLSSHFAAIRMVFDLMPTATSEDWERIATRLEAVPNALRSATAALEEGIRQGLVASERQTAAVADQLATWAGEQAGSRPWFNAYVARAPEAVTQSTTGARLEAAAGLATDALRAAHRFVAGTYAAAATPVDAVGEERYVRAAAEYLGAVIDPREAYGYGWEEVHRIEAEMAELAQEILPGASVDEAIAHLEGPEGPAVEGEAGLLAHLEALIEGAFETLEGRAFTFDERVRHVDVRVAPPGTAAAQYYTPPSLDFSRPGTYWYPTLGRDRFPTWNEASTCYHEAVPGHHLQFAQLRVLQDRISRPQSILFVSGNGEGWALYAERLMDELGLFPTAADRLGFLQAQMLRACRVVVDIGVHLGLSIPADEAFHPGETWTPALVQEFLFTRSHNDHEFLASETTRYLGIPGQAPCYKLGERVWLAGRDEARRRQGDRFDLLRWHMDALALGPLGLDLLAAELPTCGARPA
jgi:uncharacterized protein (DUF885 family)